MKALQLATKGLDSGSVMGISSYVLTVEQPRGPLTSTTLDKFASGLESYLQNNSHPRVWELLGATWAQRYDENDAALALKRPLQEVARTRRLDATILTVLSRVQFAVGQHAEAIRTLEEALGRPKTPYRWSRLLRQYRSAVHPKLVSYASIDAAIESVDLIAEGDDWRYFKGVRTPELNWTHSGFDDDMWEIGSSPLGHGLSDFKTVLDDMKDRYSTVLPPTHV